MKFTKDSDEVDKDKEVQAHIKENSKKLSSEFVNGARIKGYDKKGCAIFEYEDSK